LRLLLADIKAGMRKIGERPREGIHEAAVEKVARIADMSIAALKQQLVRDKRQRSRP
jgi:hypothetical protein